MFETITKEKTIRFNDDFYLNLSSEIDDKKNIFEVEAVQTIVEICLSKKEKEIMILKLQDKKSNTEISNILHVHRNTIINSLKKSAEIISKQFKLFYRLTEIREKIQNNIFD